MTMPSRPSLAPTQDPPSEKLSGGTSSLRQPTLANAPHLTSPELQSNSPSSPRTSSGRRLSSSLVSFLGINGTKSKRNESPNTSSEGSSEGERTSSMSAVASPLSLGTRNSSGMDEIFAELAPASSSPTTASSVVPDEPSRSPRSKPPVSLPSLFRRRLSSSASNSAASSPAPIPESSAPSNPRHNSRSGSIDRLQSWATRSSTFLGRRGSEPDPPDAPPVPKTRPTSQEYSRRSSITNSPPFATSSASPTSRSPPAFDSQTSSVVEEPHALGPAPGYEEREAAPGEGVRRSSGYGFFDNVTESSAQRGESRVAPLPAADEEPQELSDSESESGQEDDDLDAADFIRESSPASTNGPFNPITRQRPSPRIPLDSPTSESSRSSGNPSTSSPRPLSPTHLYERRGSRNLELSLPGIALGRSSSPPVAMTPSPVVSEDNPSGTIPPDSPEATPPTMATTRRLNSLPRLLSNDAYSFPTSHRTTTSTSPAVREEDTETDTDTDDNMVSADEGDSGPVPSPTMRRRPVEAIAQPASSTPTSTPPPPIVSRSPASRAGTPSAVRLMGRPSPFGSLSMAPMPSASASQAVPATWVTFDPLTPTPGAIGTARPVFENANGSYFDLPKSSNTSRTPKTPGAPLMSPLIPMSLSNAARGRRPTRQDEVESREPSQTGVVQQTAPEPEASGDLARYRLRSHSAVDIMSPGLLDSDDQPAGTAGVELDPVWRSSGVSTPGPSFLTPPPVVTKQRTPIPSPSSPKSKVLLQPSPSQKRPGTGSSLNRRRSMYELHVAPPAYQMVYQRPGVAAQIVHPREEEGREGLPDYTCAVHFEAYMPRKMEFTAPSVQAKDRSWKRQYIVLHGTSIKVYKFDLRTHPIAGEMDWSNVTADMAGSDGPPPLHFHEGEYGVDTEGGSSTKFPHSINDAKLKARSHLAANAVGGNSLVKNYSLQNAESGLAADYIKRRHVVRVRAAGEQFLLQAKDDRGVIDLIEALQAATNVSLDLDSRPLPRFITLPRRRRRRRRPAPTAEGETAPANVNPSGQTQEETRLGEMLAEEQNEAARAGAQSMS